jgi:hypothetical protein
MEDQNRSQTKIVNRKTSKVIYSVKKNNDLRKSFQTEGEMRDSKAFRLL